jgi:GNAT superfamily N-acetyltransferase
VTRGGEPAPEPAPAGRFPFTIRPAVPDDLPFLHDMLYEAAIVAPEIRALAKPVALGRPVVARYLAGWGRAGDTALVAEATDGRPIGGAWYRLYAATQRGDGIVAWAGVPELAIGVLPARRGRGVGGALLAALLAQAWRDGHRRLALSVDPANPAVRLYRRHGFREVSAPAEHAGTSLVMAVDLSRR